jgi:tripartite-type tricarboxylate transporter receptor subunit TctC
MRVNSFAELVVLAAFAGAAAMAPAAAQQAYPTRPIHIVVPLSARA